MEKDRQNPSGRPDPRIKRIAGGRAFYFKDRYGRGKKDKEKKILNSGGWSIERRRLLWSGEEGGRANLEWKTGSQQEKEGCEACLSQRVFLDPMGEREDNVTGDFVNPFGLGELILTL